MTMVWKSGTRRVEPGAVAERLHTGDHRGGGRLITRRLHDPQGEGRIDEAQFVYGLLEEFIAMRQDQGPAPRVIQFSSAIPIRANACNGWAAKRRPAAAMFA